MSYIRKTIAIRTKLYVYSKAEEAVVLKIKDVERWRLAGNTLFYSRACTDHLIVGYYPEDVYAVSLDTRQEKLLAENVMNYLVLREDKLIYALYRDVEYEKDGKLPVYQEEPALVPVLRDGAAGGRRAQAGLFEYTGRYVPACMLHLLREIAFITQTGSTDAAL